MPTDDNRPSLIDDAIVAGLQHHRAGRLGDAESFYLIAVRRDPANADAWHLLALANAAQGALRLAIQQLEYAVRLQANCAMFRANLGELYRRMGDSSQALNELETAVRLDDTDPRTFDKLGVTLRERGDFRGARAAFDRAWLLQPKDAYRIKSAFTLPIVYETAEQVRLERDRLHDQLEAMLAGDLHLDDALGELGMVVFYSAYQGEDDRRLNEMIGRVCLKAAPHLHYMAAHCRPENEDPGESSADRIVRIGFVSTFFFDHTIARLTAGIVRNLARESFHVTLCSPTTRHDPWADFLRASVDRSIVLSSNFEHAREQLAEARFDVLYYTDVGMDPLTYFLAMARLAPVQVTSWGHPVTTGLPTIDYFVSSRLLEREDSHSDYGEQLLLVDELPSFYYRPERSEIRRDRRHFGLDNDANVYLCPHSLFKLHPDFDLLLERILSRDPLARLAIVASWQPAWTEMLLERWRRTLGAEYRKVVVVPRLTVADFLELLAVADVILDPPYFSGGNTSYEALAVGTPVVTLPGALMRSRVTLGMYRQIGFDECIAVDEDDYVKIAVRLGTDPAARDAVCRGIASTVNRLFESPVAVRDLEGQLLQAVNAARHRRSDDSG